MPNELDSRAAARRRSQAALAIYRALADIVTGLGALGGALAGGDRAAIEGAVHDVVTAWTLVSSAIDAIEDAPGASDGALERARRALPAAAAVVDQLFDGALGLPDRGLHPVLQQLRCETQIFLGCDLGPGGDGLDGARSWAGRRTLSRESRRSRGA